MLQTRHSIFNTTLAEISDPGMRLYWAVSKNVET